MRWLCCLLLFPTAAVMAGPSSIQRGSLTLVSCEVGTPATAVGTLPAFCADLDVPERRTGGHSQRNISIHIAVFPATGPKSSLSPAPLLFLAGGPGQAATDSYPAMAPAFEVWRRHRDIVVIDQRGTGKSHPLTCESQDGEDASSIRKRTQACFNTLSPTADLATYTTTETVADMADVQKALGVQQWNLLGVSYGTRVAQRFALTYPEKTRSLVLDSAVPPDANLAADTGVNLDYALNARFTACLETPACVEVLGDPIATLSALRASLTRRPLSVKYRDPDTDERSQGELTAQRLEDTVRIAAYAPETAALIARALTRAKAGDGAAIMALGDMAEAELSSVGGNVLQLSVLCSEDPPTGTPSEAERNSILGTRGRDVLTAQCALWPSEPIPANFHDLIPIATPSLVLQGEWDPATPPVYGERVAKTLTTGKYLLAKGQGHNVIMRGCIPKVVADFLDEPTHSLDTKCVERIAPLPDMLDANGATP